MRQLPTIEQSIKSRLRLLSLDAAPILRAGLLPINHLMEIFELGEALARIQNESARN